MLDFAAFKETIFRQSKRNDEGVTERQRKREISTIAGTEIFPMINDALPFPSYDKTDGYYSAVNQHEIIVPLLLPNGSTLISIKPISAIGSWSWVLWRGDSSDELASGNSGEKKKVNVQIDNTINYCLYSLLGANTGIRRIEIEYVI